ncbi:MAG TPA: DNA mismatch repair protein MutS [Thermoanaerobaculia bacterium]|nr:DNA mismatch repair protein MutS [Thermoanaerobaculia bacterium]
MTRRSSIMSKPARLTPMLEQYFEIKRQVPDAILFYRLGDFYEMFFEDAEKAAPILDLVLTARGKGGEWEAPMCGVPHHAAEQYIAKLVRSGFRVAVCDQIGDPALAKGIVRREIVRVVTPGTAIEGTILDRESCYLLALSPSEDSAGAAWLDVSTGDFFVTSYATENDPRLHDDLARLGPREVILARDEGNGLEVTMGKLATVSPVEASYFEAGGAAVYLCRHFGTQTLRGFGLETNDARVGAAGAALRYASATRKNDLAHIRTLRVESEADFMVLDASTLENLEIFESRDPSNVRASLWSVLNQTKTAVGSRTLRRWLGRPLRDRDRVFDRHDAVAELLGDRTLLDRVGELLSEIADLERIVSRITLRTATARECLTLARSLEAVGRLSQRIAQLQGPLLASLRAALDALPAVQSLIGTTISDVPGPSVKEGGVIREGVDRELDELRAIAADSKSVLLGIEAEERSRTSIPSLKIRFNSVFGYYIEISKANLARVPADYIRKQTLVNAERYITPRLKELEEKILGAEEKAIAIEVALYERLLEELTENAAPILATAHAVGDLDAIASMASVAIRNRYVRPSLSDEIEIAIEEGRHPVIESISGERFIPNDTTIRRGENEIQVITGPNMGGKSTYLRQVALIVLMNQVGSFVPAGKARLGLFDRVFTRVGASDHLARGESTFMVEMHETANILNNATARSLIVLDEVGRGTATFDGLSLAWAIIEYLHDQQERNAITLFATHYHEVTDLAKTKARVTNLSVAVREWNDQIIFLRKVLPGAADKSYGIQVAKLAGIPASVIGRAREILTTLERKERDVVEETRRTDRSRSDSDAGQLSLFDTREQDVARDIRALEIETMSPIEALNRLHELKSKLMQ